MNEAEESWTLSSALGVGYSAAAGLVGCTGPPVVNQINQRSHNHLADEPHIPEAQTHLETPSTRWSTIG